MSNELKAFGLYSLLITHYSSLVFSQFGKGSPGRTMRMRWSVNLKCEPGSSIFGMWQEAQPFCATGQGLASRSSAASAFATCGDRRLACERWQAKHFES